MTNKKKDIFEEEKQEISQPIDVVVTKTKKQRKAKKKDIELEKIDFPSLEGKFLVIKVGCYEHPAKTEDITAVEDEIVSLITKNDVNCLVYVSNHKVDVKVFG